jgi:hypothetical protein
MLALLPLALAAADPVAVVELFTSEGCSSCPPADRVLAELAQDPRVIGLGFHVDYWDGLGWKDPLSTSAASGRQHAYARTLGNGDYTPQMVVDGRVEFVGSDSTSARAAVARSLEKKPSVAVAVAIDGDTVKWSLDRAPANAKVLVAIVEDGVVHRVPRGENSGRTLHHDRAVRSFVVRELDGPSGSATLTVPADVVRDKARAVVVVSDASGVLGAAQVTLTAR